MGFTVSEIFSPVLADTLTTPGLVLPDLIIASATSSSGDLPPLKDLEVPVLVHEPFALNNKMGLVYDKVYFSTWGDVPKMKEGEKTLDSLIVCDDPAAAPFLGDLMAGESITALNDTIVAGFDGHHVASWGVPGENAIKILKFPVALFQDLAMIDPGETAGNDGNNDWGDSTRYAAFVYDKGVETPWPYEEGPFTTPEKRAFYWFHDNTAAAASDVTWSIYDKLIYWCLGCLDEGGTGIGELSKSAVDLIISNLGSGQIRLGLSEVSASSLDVQVINLAGQTVLHTVAQPYASELIMDLSHQNTGIHIVKVSSETRVSTKKFVLQ
jgi:hypothetical protein